MLTCIGSAASLQAQPLAYITNQASDDRVWVIETETNTVVDTVTVADIPARVAITPDGAFAYVTIVVNEDFIEQSAEFLRSPVPSSPVFTTTANYKTAESTSFFSNKVEVIETATNTVVATVTTEDSAPFGIAITPDGEFAYVAHLGPVVTVIDTLTNAVVTTIPTEGEGLDVAITPDGAYALVTISSADIVSVIDTATNTIVATIEVGDTPSGVAITPDGEFAYVTNLRSDTVSRIDIAERTVRATLAVGEGPGSIAITPEGTVAYVTNQLSSDVSVIDITTDVVGATVAVGDTPIDVAITPDGELVYVTNIFSDSVSVLDVATNTLIDTAEAGFLPEGIAITPGQVVTEVTIDIKPGNSQNRINPESQGGVWVAILSNDPFDPLQINTASVRFGPNEATAVRYGVRDVNQDGLGDLLLRFSLAEAGIVCGDTEAGLSGQTFLLEQIAGSDSIRTAGCK